MLALHNNDNITITTLRLDDTQEDLLQAIMVSTGKKAKTKAIIYLIENADSLLKNDAAFRAIKKLDEEILIKQKMIAKLKAGN